ncbi:MAG: hypothetical protein ACRDKG_08965 [Actinomycetota bacterium]
MPPREWSFVVGSALDSPADTVWSRVTTMQGVNEELAPIFRMTHPRGLDRLPDDAPLGVKLFRSWVLLFGILPLDYDDLTLIRIEPGRGFHERSQMLTCRRWEHVRTLEPVPTGTILTDQISFEPRVSVAGPVLFGVTRRLFAHRHRRLRKRFGGRLV